MGTLVNGKLDIPAGAADYSIAAEMTTTADVTLRQMLPHTHLRGKSWEYTATYPDGRTRSDPVGAEVRLQLADRLRVRRAAQAAEGHEDPRRRALRQLDGEQVEPRSRRSNVKWGDQTWEEMMFTAFVYSLDGVAPGTVITTPPSGGQ